jgi:tetratricopeptide (TPR) repeat protein
MAIVSLQAAYDQARAYLEQNQIDYAIAVAQHILEQYPDNLEAHRILGEAYLAGRQFDQAEAAFSRVLASDPESIPAHVGLGITHERRGRLDRAVAEFEQALEIRPDMLELRSQLLRLYAEVWGSENASLRLSKPGLARLYAKGHMLPQAIQEFRSVVEESPDRLDARVGLAEALWRNGDELEASEELRGILQQRPDVLKANLLLGYMLLASGDSSGEHYWQTAQRLDPYQSVARTLFETLPEFPDPDNTLAAWDEQAWSERRSREEEERRFQEQQVAIAAGSAIADDDFFSAAWMDAREDTPPPPRRDSAADDDFLASLLAMEALPDEFAFTSDPLTDSVTMESLASDTSLQPFSFADDSAPAAPDPVSRAEPDLLPFTLDELAPTPDEFDSTVKADAFGEALQPPAEAELAPFSLSDLGLSEEEIAALAADDLPPSTSADTAEVLTMSDLGLTAELVEQIEREAPTQPDEPPLTPFSLSDLGLTDEEIAALSVDEPAQNAPAAEAELTPFALSDLGLSADDIAAIDPPPPGQSALVTPDIDPFDWSLEGEDDASATPSLNFEDDLSQLTPFSIDDLDLNSGDDQGGLRGSTLPPSLQPFSIEDGIPPSSTGNPSLNFTASDADEGSLAGYSWQQPSSRQGTGFLNAASRIEEPEETIFSKLRQMAIERGEMSDDDGADPTLADTGDAYFSDDDVSLRDDEDQVEEALPFGTDFRLPRERDGNEDERSGASAAGILAAGSIAAAFSRNSDTPPVTSAPEPELTPFSLEDLGLSAEEIALLNAETPAEPSAPEAEPELTPFSLEDLGLSAEEIALLNAETPAEPSAPVAELAEPEAEPELTPFSLEDLGLSAEEIALLNAGVIEESGEESGAQPVLDDLAPFSFDDFGLDAESTASVASGNDAATIDDAGVEPFSLDDLDFDDGDASSAQAAASRELGISDEELASLDLGDLEAAASSLVESETGDRALDRLLVIGRRQGFVELTDIIAVVENPEEETDRIEEIGWALHNSGIQIRDQGEIIDMTETEEVEAEDEMLAVEDEVIEALDVTASPTPQAEPDLTPFSLSELGLTDEEIAALGLAEAAPAASLTEEARAPATTEPEPELTPFSLEDLGLSAEEIAALESATEPTIAEAEPELTPFSLEDLGLSAEEIAALESVTEPPTAELEPELTPFSLEDLGLSAEEIASLESVTEPTTAEVEPELTPFSLEDLGLSADEIAALDAETAAEPSAEPLAEEGDLFDFSVIEAAAPETLARAQRVAPREEEPPTPIDPADAAFVPEPLEAMDDVWNAAPPPPAPEIARVVLPPREERRPSGEPIGGAVPTARRARREPVPVSGNRVASWRDLAAKPRSERAHLAASKPLAAPILAASSLELTGNPAIDEYLEQLAAEPGNLALRFAVARVAAQSGHAEVAASNYKQIIRSGIALDRVVEDLEDLIPSLNDDLSMRQFYRVLGDAYTKQGRVRDAIAAYGYTLSQ